MAKSKTKKMTQKLTKKLLWVHRYTGLFLSLLFLCWFLSGFVMMYKGFPYLSKTEALARAEAIIPSNDWITPQELYQKHNLVNHRWASIKVVSKKGRPMYRLQDDQGKFYCFFADTGQKVPAFSESEAKDIVSHFTSNKVKIAQVEKMTTLDQWTPRTRFLPYLPAYRVYLDDGKGTICYVSSITGQLFQKLNTADKIWAWLGPIPHWIYFKNLRIHTQLWRDIIVALSLVGVVMCLTGLYMGIVRVRRRKKGKKWTLSPYKKVWFKWHHYTGFVFGLFTFTWILSGFFSMNPWKWSPSNSLNSEAKQVWQGGKLSPQLFSVNPSKAITDLKEKVSALTLTRFAGKPYYQIQMANGTSKLLLGNGRQAPLERLAHQSYTKQVQAMHPKVKIARAQELTDYDAYYYDKHRTKPLPVLKVDFADNANTTYYINPKTAKVVMKYENTSRVNRWVYHGLHSLDFPALFFRRPLWDIIVIVLLLGGTSVSITGLMLTWKWLKRKVNFR